jgi:outer membrane protein assembly factor BamE
MPIPPSRNAMRKLFSSVLLVAVLSGCTAVGDFFKPYRIDVRQGNFVTQEMVSQLKSGMTRDQVRFVLGTPLVTDVFHSDRWDYIYRFQPGKGSLQERRLTVIFQDGKLARLEGDVRAGETPSQP